MNILYDISVLGMGHYHLGARTGVFRVVENVAYGLSETKECNIDLCATISLDNLNQTIDYLKASPKFERVQFFSPGISKDIYKALKDIVEKINERPKVRFPLKVLRKLLCYPINYIQRHTQLITPKNLIRKDIFHSPFFPVPEIIKAKNNLKVFLTIYDLIPILHPQFFHHNKNHLIKNIVDDLNSDTWVLCISNSTKNDLCNYTKNINPAKVFVTHLAASDLFYNCNNIDKIKTINKKYSIPPDVPYVLSLGTLEPRKNIVHTIRCFAKLVSQEKITDLHIVIVGTKGWDFEKIFKEISNSNSIKNRIIITGFVDDDDLAALYSRALVFVYPSFYEGFGLPPLEAMQCGVPVITSNTSSFPEVIGDAGIMVSPTDEDSMCQSILDIYKNPTLRKSLSLKSIERAQQFSWQKCVQETLKAYKSALHS